MDARTGPWGKTLNALASNYPQFTFIPGHGNVARPADIATFADYLATLHAAVAEAKIRGESGDVLVKSVLPRLKEKYGSWGFFDDFAKDNILQTSQELDGRKPVPQPAKPDGTE